MTKMSPSEPISEQAREFIVKKLRAEYPFLKQEALDDLAQQCKQCIADRIDLEAPHMEASHARQNLLSIPPEIRNRICLMVLSIANCKTGIEGPDGTFVIELADYYEGEDGDDDDDWVHFTGTEGWMVQPALTRVCKQLRSETLPVYYGANTILVHVWDYANLPPKGNAIRLNSNGAQAWLRDIGAENRALIKSVVVLNDSNHLRVCGEQFALALREAGVGLDNCAFRSFSQPVVYEEGRFRKQWKAITAEDENISSATKVIWKL